MSRLTPSLLVLDKGLDLQTAKILAPEGSVFDSLNYEQVDFQGQKRIDGYARYDGTLLPAFDEYYLLNFTPSSGWTGFPDDVNTNLFVNGKLWAVAIKNANVAGNSAYIQILDYSLEVGIGDSIFVGDTSIGDITSLMKGSESGVSISAHYDNLLELSSTVRTRVTTLPEPIAGLHWFKDRLYAVAGVVQFSVTTATIWINREITFTSSGAKGIVVDQIGNSIFILTSHNPISGETVTNPELGTLVLGDRSEVSSIATFYESRTEQQTLIEDGPSGPFQYGWKVNNLGWTVNFDRGIALYGELASLNQNRQNVGIEGPTDVTGTNGSPAILTQNVAVTNKPEQVNGWKSYDSPNAYLLDPSDVQQLDTTYVYADAFVSWSADSNVVAAPGSDLNNLVEYPPTNSIRYTT